MTGTVSAAEDSLRGAESLINRYGSVENGGMILHVTYPDQFISEMETAVGQIMGLADNPRVKMIKADPDFRAARGDLRPPRRPPGG